MKRTKCASFQCCVDLSTQRDAPFGHLWELQVSERSKRIGELNCYILKCVSEIPPTPKLLISNSLLCWQCQVFYYIAVLDNMLFPLDKEVDFQISKI